MPLPQDLGDVAEILQVAEGELKHCLTRVHLLYREKSIPKSPEGSRRITKAAPSLELLHGKLLQWVNGYTPHRAAHGWRSKRSTMTCVDPHIGRELIVKFDIEDFFPSVSFTRVCDTLQHLGCGAEAAAVITKLTTAKGCLPQGFSTSPALANLVFIRCDARITGLCTNLSFTYTRYGDDLAISGRNVRRNYLIHRIREIISNSGYKVNEEKFTRSGVQLRSQRQQILGIVVNAKRSLPSERLTKYEDSIRELHEALDSGDEVALRAIYDRVRGQIGYAKQVSPQQGERLLALLLEPISLSN